MALLVGMLFTPGMTLAETAEALALPAVGDTLHGFTVQEIRDERLIDAKTVTMTHDKTGATVLYIAADDVDCSFDISFRTPNLNDKGIPHVFEHITISGSEKYPAQNLFFPLITQTYNTFVNAMTYPKMTTYPMASMSEDQLLLLSDYYLDGVFHPMVYNDERYYQREAWRYELTDKDEPLTLSGTVYNEMRGNDNIQSAANYDLLETLYPDSIVANVNGGDPEAIPEMTHQELLDFHDAYYHPSNSLSVLYGNMDDTRFLELLDSYFSEFDAKEFDLPDGKVALNDAYVETVEQFPVEAGSPTENASIVQYAFVVPDLPLDESFGVSILLALLTHESSPLTRAVREEFPTAQFYATVDSTLPDPYIVFYFEGVNTDDREAIKDLIDRELAGIAEAGIDADLIDAMIASEEFSNLLIPESSMLGVSLSVSIANLWSNKGTTDYFNIMLDTFDEVKQVAHDGYFEEMLQTMLLDNQRTALVTTEPAPGMAEEKADALAEKLAAVKAAMSDEEIEALIEDGKALTEWSQEEAPKEMIEQLTAVSADTLPEETKQYEVTEGARADGVATMTAPASVGGIGTTTLLLDTSGVPQDMLMYYELYVSLIGMVDTESYERAELQTLITRYLNGVGASASAMWYADDSWRPTLTFSWMSLMEEDFTAALDVARELLFTSRVDDLAMIRTVVGQAKVGLRNQMNNMTYGLQLSRAMATSSEYAAYQNYLSGLDYYAFLTDVERQLDEDPDGLVAKLEEARGLIQNKENAMILFAGNDEGIQAFDANIDTLLGDIEAAPIEQAELDLPIPAQHEALSVDSSVQYNLLYASLKELGVEYTAKYDPLSLLIYDAYLTPQIRHGIGAYDNVNQMSRSGFLFISYRDPSITETFRVYESLPQFVASADVTQEDIDRYIVSAYSSYAMPQGDLSGATSAMNNRVLGWPDDIKLIRMREIKSTTVEDFRALEPVFEKLLEVGVRSTGGGATMINQNKDLYDVILNLEDE